MLFANLKFSAHYRSARHKYSIFIMVSILWKLAQFILRCELASVLDVRWVGNKAKHFLLVFYVFGDHPSYLMVAWFTSLFHLSVFFNESLRRPTLSWRIILIFPFLIIILFNLTLIDFLLIVMSVGRIVDTFLLLSLLLDNWSGGEVVFFFVVD